VSRQRVSRQRAIGLALLLGALLWIAVRFVTLRRAAFHWDEFALFDSVARTIADGVLHSGGRPGLAQLLVMPWVEGCSDEVAVGRSARVLWLAITSASLAGLFVMLTELLREREHRYHDAALGVGLLALLPVFLESSIQVRTDQIALLGAVWGGAALLRSERTLGLALAAGLLFGLGWLGSQKLAYAAALMALLAAGRLFARASFVPRREAWRGALCLAGFATVLLCFRAFSMWLFTLPETHAARILIAPQLGSAQSVVFPFYRNTIGYSQYVAMLPSLAPHLALGAGLLAASALAWRQRESLRWLGVAWAVLALGLAVGLFHAAAFSYFWMTLGLFPAVAGALAIDPVRRRVFAAVPRWRAPAAAALWISLALPALATQAWLLRDTQTVQADSLSFVHRNFAPAHGGFQPEGAVFCAPPQPLGIWFSQTLFRRFEGPHREHQIAWIKQHFRTRPIHYLVESFRLNQFPLELRRFFSEHYQPYRDSVFVAGRTMRGGPDEPLAFELLVEGPYRWLPRGSASQLRVDGMLLAPGAIAQLPAGAHEARFETGGEGLLVLSLRDAPAPSPLSFYPNGVLN
jgi:hypothetical protein